MSYFHAKKYKFWFILVDLGVDCCILLGTLVFLGLLVHFPPFWYVAPRKIWQPWTIHGSDEKWRVNI
jgi:hypothetical protein